MPCIDQARRHRRGGIGKSRLVYNVFIWPDAWGQCDSKQHLSSATKGARKVFSIGDIRIFGRTVGVLYSISSTLP